MDSTRPHSDDSSSTPPPLPQPESSAAIPDQLTWDRLNEVDDQRPDAELWVDSSASEGTPKVEETPGPVGARERIGSIDVLRGVAVLGILLLNIHSFGGPDPINEVDPAVIGDDKGANPAILFVLNLLFESKMRSIFAMLFGAGLILLADRVESRGGDPAMIYYKRVLWLLLFGACHALFLWYGDILYTYAICGLLLFPIRKVPPIGLIAISIVVLGIWVLGMSLGAWQLQSMHEQYDQAAELKAAGEPVPDSVQSAAKAYRGWIDQAGGEAADPNRITLYQSGTYGEIFADRLIIVLLLWTIVFIFFSFWQTCALMCIGMVLMRWRVFTASLSKTTYLAMIVLGYGLGLPMVYQGFLIEESDRGSFLGMLESGAMIYNEVACIPVAIGHIGVVMLICKYGLIEPLTRRLAAVGRMALTNYLMHTLICTTLFYGYGFGLYGRLDSTAYMGIVAAIWTLQLILSPVWLNYYQFGPAEWLWRTLTYFKIQPMTRKASHASSTEKEAFEGFPIGDPNDLAAHDSPRDGRAVDAHMDRFEDPNGNSAPISESISHRTKFDQP